jgi:HEAT repeats
MSKRHKPGVEKPPAVDWKRRLEILGLLLGTTAAIIGIIIVFHPLRKADRSNLEIVDFRCDNSGHYPRVTVKLRNTGGQTAFLKRVEFLLSDAAVKYDPTIYTAFVEPVTYNVMFTKANVTAGEKAQSVSRKIEPDNVDALEFVIGYEELKSQVSGDLRLVLQFNESQKVVTIRLPITIDNFVARYPVPDLASTSEAVLDQLSGADDATTQRYAIQKLKTLGNKNTSRYVTRYLDSKSLDVRRAASDALTALADTQATTALVRALGDPDEVVRGNIIKALKSLGDAGVAEIGHFLEGADPVGREAALYALGDCGGDGASTLVIRSLSDHTVIRTRFGDDITVASVAARVLGRLGNASNAGKLADTLGSARASERGEAVAALGKIGAKDKITRVVGMLDDPAAQVRQQALNALVELSGQGKGWTIAQWKQWSSQNKGSQ